MARAAIVIGADFSEGSHRALQAIRLLAKGAPVPIRLVHAFPPGKPRLSGPERLRMKESIAQAEARESLQLSALAERLRRDGFQVEAVAIQGKAAATLLAQARQAKAGLIAVGTTGRKGVKGLFLGSVAQAVLRDSPVPVLVAPVRDRKGRRRVGPVLAAVDAGPSSAAVIEAASNLASDLGVALYILHTIPLPFSGEKSADWGGSYTPEVFAADEAKAATRVTKLAEGVRSHVRVEPIGLGDPATHILLQAARLGAAAIVVGRRKAGRRLGSVSSAVVHAADRPVIVVPAGYGGLRPIIRLKPVPGAWA